MPVSTAFDNLTPVSSEEEAEEEPEEVKTQDEEPSSKEGDFDVNIVYPPEDMDVNTGLYITEHSTVSPFQFYHSNKLLL